MDPTLSAWVAKFATWASKCSCRAIQVRLRMAGLASASLMKRTPPAKSSAGLMKRAAFHSRRTGARAECDHHRGRRIDVCRWLSMEAVVWPQIAFPIRQHERMRICGRSASGGIGLLRSARRRGQRCRAASTTERAAEPSFELNRQGRVQNAAALLFEITAADPEWIPPHQLLAEIYYRAGQLTETQSAARLA